LLWGLATSNTHLYEADSTPVSEVTVRVDRMSVPDKIRHYSPDKRVAELAIAIHLAENINNEVCNSNGCRYGISSMQIVQSTFDEQCQGDVYNEDDNIKCGLKMIANKELWRWKQSAYDMPNHKGWLNRLSTTTREYALEILNDRELMTCSCVALMRELGHTFPRIPDPSYLEPNSFPFVGGLILLDLELPHIGHIVALGAEYVYYKERILINGQCLTRENKIEYVSSKLRGFFQSPL